MITREEGKDDFDIILKGDTSDVMIGFKGALNYILKNASDKAAQKYRDVLKSIIISDEQRRFQNNGA